MSRLARIGYVVDRFFSGVRYWCHKRLTPAGLGILCALIAAALMGPDTENNVAYQAFTLLICMLVVAAAFSWWFRASFSARRLLPRFGTAGCPLAYTVMIKNRTGKNQAGLTLMEELADSRPSFHDWRAAQLAEQRELRSFRFSARPRANPFRLAALKDALMPAAMPQEEVPVQLEVTPLRRGV